MSHQCWPEGAAARNTAWKEHWGSFVKPAALLQGVIAERDVMRLLDANVEVFWSHDLDRFEEWIAGSP